MYTAECRAAKGIFDYLNGKTDMMTLYELWQNVDYPFTRNDFQFLVFADYNSLFAFYTCRLSNVY